MSNQITPKEVLVIEMALSAIVEDLSALPKGVFNKPDEEVQQDILVSAKSALVKIAQVSGQLIKLDPYKEGDEKEFLKDHVDESKAISEWALLDNYNENKQAIFDYFKYKQDYTSFPIDDRRCFYWRIHFGDVIFSEEPKLVRHPNGQHYEEKILLHRHYKTQVYPGKDFTMIMVDTMIDDNKFLAIYENSKRIEDEL